MKAVCDSETGLVLFCQESPDEQPESRVVVDLDAGVAEYARMGFPLVWNGGDSVTVGLDYIRTEKRARVKELRDIHEWGGAETPVGRVDTTGDSQRKISGAVQMATFLGASFEILFRMYDNSEQLLNASQMITVGLAVGNHVNMCQQRKNVLDRAIRDATTLEELEAIDIEGGWPS